MHSAVETAHGPETASLLRWLPLGSVDQCARDSSPRASDSRAEVRQVAAESLAERRVYPL